MKKSVLSMCIISGMLFILDTQTTNAQWTHSGTVTYLTTGTDNVGIGTTAPSYKLDIKNGANCNFRVQSTATGSANLILSRATNAYNSLVNYKTGTTDLWFTGCKASDDFGISNSTNTTVLSILQTGFVGIGNTAPAEALDVTGNIKASGKVSAAQLRIGTTTGATGFIACIGGKLIAEEVRVDLKAAWPDYVFANDYKLMSLEELEASINTYKHLPGIPSAAEMKDNGITLGEMQTKTIEKIEEHSLYLIQLKKENNELRKRIEALEKK